MGAVSDPKQPGPRSPQRTTDPPPAAPPPRPRRDGPPRAEGGPQGARPASDPKHASRAARRARKAELEPVTRPIPVPALPRQPWQRLLRAEQPTGPMPLVDRLRGTPFRDPRRMEAPEDRQAREAVDFALRLGELMIRSGAGTRDVEATLIAATAALGLTHVEVDITVQSVLVQHAAPGRQPLTLVRVARGESRDFSRLVEAHRLVDDMVCGGIAHGDALTRLREIEEAAKPWPRWVVGAGWGLLAAGVTALVGGGALAVLLAFVTSFAVDRLGRVLGRRGLPSFFVTFVGAAVASLVTVTAVEAGLLPTGDAGAVIAGGIVVLLPGRMLVAAVEDAISGFAVTASGRVLQVLLTAAAIISGVGLGLGLARRLGLHLEVEALGTSPADLTRAVVAAGIAALASGVANRDRWNHALAAAGIAVVGFATYALLQGAAVTGGTVATACAAVAVGLLARALGQRMRAPSLVLAVPALSALLPGLTIFRGMTQLALSDQTGAGVNTLLSATTTALAIAAGIVLGDFLAAPADRTLRRRHPGG
jgi:uncharacterized membrane protein YjjP (DUF1212 family)